MCNSCFDVTYFLNSIYCESKAENGLQRSKSKLKQDVNNGTLINPRVKTSVILN